jgi:hypothetical protein
MVAMALADLLSGLGMFYGIGLGLFFALDLFMAGRFVRGILVLLVGTPALGGVGAFVFGIVTVGIQAIFRERVRHLIE